MHKIRIPGEKNGKRQWIVRSGTFDSGHRVMNEKMKCFNMHGHTYLYKLNFEFKEMEEIGYAIDFKEIKRVACQWIDDYLDHGMIVNPQDSAVIDAVLKTRSKIWYMTLNGAGNYCNPSVENLAKEVFLAMEILFESYKGLSFYKLKLNETPNCYTICKESSISDEERKNWKEVNYELVKEYANKMGIVEYDDRK
jgi:6-pyruvoyltetrahydropterin/6-carboxytetrahydropterin synthase